MLGPEMKSTGECLGIGIEFLFGNFFDFRNFFNFRQQIIIQRRKYIHIRNIDIDIVGFQILVEFINGLFGEPELFENFQLALGQLPVFLALFHQVFNLLFGGLGRLFGLAAGFVGFVAFFRILFFRFVIDVVGDVRQTEFCVCLFQKQICCCFQFFRSHFRCEFDVSAVCFLFCTHDVYPFPLFFSLSASARRSGFSSWISCCCLIALM